ncbi:hypothetical protein SH668x_002714 [Planctomicrobium sp. SH668]|uniref:hypothetical protein n=1 Tax=Planctomicrobium sp. SH668 TaxID=3448126 RepID=UPI003F5BE47A
MSEQTSHNSVINQPADDSSLFTESDLKQFDRDDAAAGAAIGKLLTFFFLYTVLAMVGATWATYYWITYQPLK